MFQFWIPQLCTNSWSAKVSLFDRPIFSICLVWETVYLIHIYFLIITFQVLPIHFTMWLSESLRILPDKSPSFPCFFNLSITGQPPGSASFCVIESSSQSTWQLSLSFFTFSLRSEFKVFLLQSSSALINECFRLHKLLSVPCALFWCMGCPFRETKAIYVTNFSKIKCVMEEKTGLSLLYQVILLLNTFFRGLLESQSIHFWEISRSGSSF